MTARAKRARQETAGPVSYHAGRFPPDELDWTRLVPLIGPASSALARYDALLSAVPNAEVLLSPLTTQEAVLSSRIEGTVTTMGEVLAYEVGGNLDTIDSSRAEDYQEVLNYRHAMREAVTLLNQLPLCGRLVRQVHASLLAGVRGDDKARGCYRTIQNYIGTPGRPIEQARFVPIAPELLDEGMAQWEKYIHADAPDRLIQLAIMHAEFESLHPFLDGNGRLGRMLIPLFLFAHELLHAPMFYLSEYLDAHREAYYDRLLAVSEDNDWTGWSEFFLQAIAEQATTNATKARTILDLYEAKKTWVVDSTHSQYAIVALDFVFGHPIFLATDFIEKTGMHEATARRILKALSDNKLLKSIREASGRRSAIFIFPELLNLAEGREVF